MGRKTRHIIGAAVALVLALVIGIVAGEGPLLLGGHEAHAVIGRPLTPVSYAGVARRTTRRTVAATSYAGAYYAPPVVASTAVVTVLPAGCVRAGAYYSCGAVRYEPYYNGPTLVYRQL